MGKRVPKSRQVRYWIRTVRGQFKSVSSPVVTVRRMLKWLIFGYRPCNYVTKYELYNSIYRRLAMVCVYICVCVCVCGRGGTRELRMAFVYGEEAEAFFIARKGRRHNDTKQQQQYKDVPARLIRSRSHCHVNFSARSLAFTLIVFQLRTHRRSRVGSHDNFPHPAPSYMRTVLFFRRFSYSNIITRNNFLICIYT